MYSVNSLSKYFDRRPQFEHHRSAVLDAALARADEDGLIAAGADWSWLDDYIAQDFFAECERDPLGMFGDDMKRLDGRVVIQYLMLNASNFPDAQHGDVVVEGTVGLQLGGIPGQFRFDTEIISPFVAGTTYWHNMLLRGWSGMVQVVMVVDGKGLRSLEVRRKSD